MHVRGLRNADSLTGHMHEREISHHLGAPTAFIPHVLDLFLFPFLSHHILI